MNRARTLGLVSALVILTAIGFASGQNSQPAPEVSLFVGGEVPHPLKLTASDLARLRRQTIHAKERDGKEAGFEGVLLVDVLKAAGVKLGHDLRGPAMANYLVVEAADGYRCVFSMPELDPDFTDHIVLLADRRDEKPLDKREGPLRVVVLGDKRPARWVRQVTALKVGRAEPSATNPK
jgi:DMSO/TMAO reductase YedYZ molybdopterin-dependent catalytic subunit